MNAKQYIHDELIRKTRSEIIHSYQKTGDNKTLHTIDLYLNYPQYACDQNNHIHVTATRTKHERAMNECMRR